MQCVIYIFIFALFAALGYVFLLLYLLSIMVVMIILYVGYSVAYMLHMASCGFLCRFEEFTPYSCYVGKCGLTVDKGGPDGQGFLHHKLGMQMLFPYAFSGRGGGGGGGGGGGDGGGDGGGGGMGEEAVNSSPFDK